VYYNPNWFISTRPYKSIGIIPPCFKTPSHPWKVISIKMKLTLPNPNKMELGDYEDTFMLIMETMQRIPKL
jgi:hypothetical protein